MRVSFIIPTLNEQANVTMAVARAEAAGAFEVIVADGGSLDETLPLASRTNARVIRSNAGRAAQMNAGAAKASGDVLLFIHCDNWLSESAAQEIAEACRDGAEAWGGFRQRVEAAGVAYRLIEHGNACRARWQGLVYGDQGLFVTRVLYERVGGFPDLPLMEDFAISQQLRKIVSPVLLPGPIRVSPRRWQQTGMVRQTLRNWSIATAYRLGVSPRRLASWYDA